MRPSAVVLGTLLLLCGCSEAGFGSLAVGVASVASLQRTPLDAIYGSLIGRDCSLARLDRGETYCRPPEPPPLPQPYCTRSLGGVDCWGSAEGLGAPPPPGVADGPWTLTPAQERDRTARWPQARVGVD